MKTKPETSITAEDQQEHHHNLEEVLRQMRVRRYMNNKINADQAEALRNELEAFSGFKRISKTMASAAAINEHEDEQEERIYWRRLQAHRQNPDILFDTPPRHDPASPNSVAFGMKEMIEREVISKLQGTFIQHQGGGNANSRNTNKNPHRGKSTVKFGRYAEQAKQLEYTQDQFHQLIDDRDEFIRLQRSLRNNGAVTNELLKQVLPFVVKQSQERRLHKSSETECD